MTDPKLCGLGLAQIKREGKSVPYSDCCSDHGGCVTSCEEKTVWLEISLTKKEWTALYRAAKGDVFHDRELAAKVAERIGAWGECRGL